MMKLQSNEWAKCNHCGNRTEQIQEEKFGCDWCKKELHHPLEINLFGEEEGSAPSVHLCSWRCVAAILPTLKCERFLNLPYVSFNDDWIDEGQSVEDFLAILKPSLEGEMGDADKG